MMLEDPDYDDGQDCGRWDQRYGGLAPQCQKAGTEFCEFDCPYSDFCAALARQDSPDDQTQGEGR